MMSTGTTLAEREDYLLDRSLINGVDHEYGVCIVATLLLLVYIGIGCAIYLASKSWTLCVDYCDQGSYSTLWALLIYFSGFSVSVSFTKFVAIRMAYLCGDNGARNFCIFLLILLLNYFLLIFWSPITSFIKFLIIVLPVILKEVSINDFIVSVAEMVTFGNMWEAMISPEEIFRVDSGIDAFSLQFLSLSPSLFRLCLSVVFLGSFLFRPLVMRPLNLVWRRRCRK